jgi:1-acyl-sn-glycerol-3-phosphate acyltransferase
MGYRFARFFINLFIKLVMRLKVEGMENLPASGAYIIASNHLGRLDVPLVYYYTNRDDVALMAAEKYYKNTFFRWFGNQLNAIWVDRFNADFAAMRKALGWLKQGHVLVLAPEGTRSPTGSLIQARAGTGFLAAKAGVPILPVALTGSEDRLVKYQLSHLRPANITIRVGKTFILPPLPTRERETATDQYADEIMCRIAALLPAAYRGVYADHPRLKEILITNS